jgi:hypothetical protein
MGRSQTEEKKEKERKQVNEKGLDRIEVKHANSRRCAKIGRGAEVVSNS